MVGKARKKPQPWGGGGYVALPHAALRSHTYGNLSAGATKLLNDLLSQYYGSNNGNLCAAMTLMKKRGWKSNSMLTRARKELEEKGLISQSRQGGRHKPTLYSITLYWIDECFNKKTKQSSHEVEPTKKPANSWAHLEPDIEPVVDLKTAQKKQKAIEAESNILQLEKQIAANPNAKDVKQMEAGIDHWKAQKN